MLVKMDTYFDGEAWCARGIDEDIFTQGTTYDDLLKNIREAVSLLLKMSCKIKTTLPPESMKYLKNVKQTLQVGIKPYKDDARFKEIIHRVNDAALQKKSIEMVYFTMSRKKEAKRKVDPYRIWLFNGTFYLIGYCHMRREIRIFALDRIKMLHQTKESFEVAEGFNFEEFIYRAVTPTLWELFFGGLLILLVLEATRRTTSWILPSIVGGFLIYAYVGPWLPPPWTHRGYGIDRLVGHMYMTLEGIFGVPIDVSSTFIILFTIYGSFLEFSGAGKFFIDFSLTAMGGKPTGAGRTVTLASFLLGGPSGSRVATTQPFNLFTVLVSDFRRPPQRFAGKTDAVLLQIAAIVSDAVERVTEDDLGIITIPAMVGLYLRLEVMAF